MSQASGTEALPAAGLQPPPVEQVLGRIVEVVGGLAGVVAISLGGSTQSGLADEQSDLDLHVFWQAPLAAPAERAARLQVVGDPGSVQVDIREWGLEDWLVVDGRSVELVYLPFDDIREEVETAYSVGLNSEGFTTAFLYSVAQGRVLHDPSGSLGQIRDRLNGGFPEATRRLLLTKQAPLPRIYLQQLHKAQRRGDLLLVQHRRSTLQMVFFNILFTLNQMYHPGEKRLLIHARRCQLQPVELHERWERVARYAADDPRLVDELASLVEELINLVDQERI